MIVVADTTPIRYLVVIEREHLLPALYGRVLIPRLWRRNLTTRARLMLFALGSSAIQRGSGELEAIALAEELAADLLLVDEWDARIEGERRRLRTVGTLRVLADGARRGLTDLEESFDRLRHTKFRVNSELLKSLLEEYRRDKANDRQKLEPPAGIEPATC